MQAIAEDLSLSINLSPLVLCVSISERPKTIWRPTERLVSISGVMLCPRTILLILYYTVLGSLFVYAPNKVAPVIFAVAYALSAAGHIWQCL